MKSVYPLFLHLTKMPESTKTLAVFEAIIPLSLPVMGLSLLLTIQIKSSAERGNKLSVIRTPHESSNATRNPLCSFP